ncbi:MAG: hydantoinase/oxoprolinase family protein [Alphaproteobacteria bacterium]|jgi:N-methylhydantoinase A
MSGWIVGVDVGGTFTDIFAINPKTGEIKTAKTPSTPADQSIGFLNGLSAISDLQSIDAVVHGTTVGTNALLERKGARTGLITSEGFRDVLEMRRRDRPRTWGLRGTFRPVAQRKDRIEVPERVLSDGRIERSVDVEAVEKAARNLASAGCEAIAIAFVNAYANSQNETAAREAVERVWPNAHVTTATDILPEIREFERTSTAVLNAYLQPAMGRYLGRLQRSLGEDGASLLIVQSNGGLMTADEASKAPIRTALSGPAAGVVAARAVGLAAGYPNVIGCDMGGTSFDVSLIANGRTSLAAETSIDFGMVVRAPMVEITTIGAGGGSIAWIDAGGMLRVGPESAGADPGPACYGKGGNLPTVTDANVLLGRINPDNPIGGELGHLDISAAEKAIKTEVADPLGLSVIEAAEAVIKVANAAMAGAIRIVSIERGHDPSQFVAMPFGGGGALHAGALIREVGLAGAVSPRYPGVLSALGANIADMRLDRVQTINSALDNVEEGYLADLAARFWTEGSAKLESSRAPIEKTEIEIELDMHYQGQTHSIPVRLLGDELSAIDLSRDAVLSTFEAAYKKSFGRLLIGPQVRVMNLRVAVIGRRPPFDLGRLAPTAGNSERSLSGMRKVYADGKWHEASVFKRLELPIGTRIDGPAILEQPDATIFVDPGLVAEVDRLGNIFMHSAG